MRGSCLAHEAGAARRPYERRAHWRRQLVGPREDRRVEMRFIRSTIVNAHMGEPVKRKEYRLKDDGGSTRAPGSS